MNSLTDWERELALLENKSNLRKLPVIRHWGREVEVNGKVMLNLSSNDYLGLAAYLPLRTEFLQSLTPDTFLPSSSSSRLLTGNFNIYVQIEDLLARLFRKESALVFNSGYHMNAGILPAVSDARTLILADKLVHASIIDGIRLSAAKCIRYRHNRYDQLEQLLVSNHAGYDRIIIVTESIFSMDGDEADLRRLVTLKQQYDNVLLYVDEAHSYKNLFLYTKMRNVAGLSTSDAQKSSDMLLKCRYIDEITDGKGIVFATGTPVSNSMTELYTMMRYLQHDMLQSQRLTHFDCWASTFGETQTAIELAPEGYTLIGR